MMFVYVV